MLASKTFKRASVAVVAGLLALPVLGSEALAGAKAYSSLHVEDFIFSDGDTGTQLDFTDFEIIIGGNTGTNSASLNGVGDGPNVDGPNIGDIDPLLACVGGGCATAGLGGGAILENDFRQQTTPPPDSFARADSRLLGAAISNAPGASADSVTADTVAEVQLLGAPAPGESGVGNSEISNDTIFQFTLDADRRVNVSFSAQGIIELILHPEAELGSLTGADFGFSITVAEQETGTVVFSWTPNGVLGDDLGPGATEILDGADLTQEFSRFIPGTTFIDTGLVLFSATTGLLFADTLYTLTISHDSNARAVKILAVPEPASLALFGIGLVAIGLIALQRRRSSDGMA